MLYACFCSILKLFWTFRKYHMYLHSLRNRLEKVAFVHVSKASINKLYIVQRTYISSGCESNSQLYWWQTLMAQTGVNQTTRRLLSSITTSRVKLISKCTPRLACFFTIYMQLISNLSSSLAFSRRIYRLWSSRVES